MSFLTINGTDYGVVSPGATQQPSIWRGGLDRAENNALLDSRTDEKRIWKFQLEPMSQADAETFTALVNGGPVTVAGAAMPSGGVTAIVTVEDVPYEEDSPLSFVRVVNITVNEA